MKPKLLRTLDLVNEQMTAALLFEAAGAVFGALLGLVIIILLGLGAATAVAILGGFSVTHFGVATIGFMLGGMIGGMLVYGSLSGAISREESTCDA